jgi:hypothetical protein
VSEVVVVVGMVEAHSRWTQSNTVEHSATTYLGFLLGQEGHRFVVCPTYNRPSFLVDELRSGFRVWFLKLLLSRKRHLP